MNALRFLAPLALAVIGTAPVRAQARPDLSGIWRLLPAESQMIGGGGPPSDEYQLTWLIDHRDPEISVVVNVREADGSHEFTFRCTTDGRECVSELPSIQETRHMTAVWDDGGVLVMTQRASSPRGGFEAGDRVYLADGGERLVFERVVTNERGDWPVRHTAKHLLGERWRKINRSRSRVRARGGHGFHVGKRLWGFGKVRYRGIAKNAARAYTAFALANLYLLRKRLLPPGATCAL